MQAGLKSPTGFLSAGGANENSTGVFGFFASRKTPGLRFLSAPPCKTGQGAVLMMSDSLHPEAEAGKSLVCEWIVLFGSVCVSRTAELPSSFHGGWDFQRPFPKFPQTIKSLEGDLDSQ